MRFIFLISIIFTFCAAVFAQKDDALRLNETEAFALDRTTPEQALKILGSPQEDKTEKLKIIAVEDWLKKDFKKSDCRVLLFSPFRGLGKVRLTFLNDKLVAINFIIEKKVLARELPAIYKTQFVPVFSESDTRESLSEFEKQTSNVKVADFPKRYNMIALTSTSVLVAKIFNDYVIGDDVKREPRTFPTNTIRTNPIIGRAQEIQILSRQILQ